MVPLTEYTPSVPVPQSIVDQSTECDCLRAYQTEQQANDCAMEFQLHYWIRMMVQEKLGRVVPSPKFGTIRAMVPLPAS